MAVPAQAEQGADALLLRHTKRPAPIKIPQPMLLDDCEDMAFLLSTAHRVATPVARPLFRCADGEQQQEEPAVGSRACVDGWLSVMEVSSKCCSSASSVSSFDSLDLLRSTPRSWSSSTSLATAECPPAQPHEARKSTEPDLPPPAFVVLGLLNAH